MTDGANHVDFPSSSPHVLACGGTKLIGSGSAITSEIVWNKAANNEGATGGGVSSVFARPTWQSSSSVPTAGSFVGRGVPGVPDDADAATGYTVRVDGQTLAIVGTSAVAPPWAGLIALNNAQNKTTAGFLQLAIYSAKAQSAFNGITLGNNGAFAVGTGWAAHWERTDQAPLHHTQRHDEIPEKAANKEGEPPTKPVAKETKSIKKK